MKNLWQLWSKSSQAMPDASTSARGLTPSADTVSCSDVKRQDEFVASWVSIGCAGHGRALRSAVLAFAAVLTLIVCAAPAAGDGACCFWNTGTCDFLSQEDCESMGGAFKGENVQCIDVVCTGICCVQQPDGSEICVNSSSNDCTGIFRGGGFVCENGFCDFRGACCFPSGDCEDDLAFEQCEVLGGRYLGFDTTCDANACLGACCIGSDCMQRTLAECTNMGGEFLGIGSDCPDDCRVVRACEIRSELEPVNGTAITLPKFNTMGGTRVLTAVSIEIRANINASAILLNENDMAAASDTEFFMLFQLQANPLQGVPPETIIDASSGLFGGSELPLQCDGDCDPIFSEFVCPGDYCDFSNPAATVGQGGTESIKRWFGDRTINIDGAFFGEYVVDGLDNSFSLLVNSNSGFLASITNATLSVRERADWEICVVYRYEPIGACCYCIDDATICEDMSASECAENGGVFDPSELCFDQIDNPDGVICPVIGVCCRCDGECEPSTEEDCRDDVALSDPIYGTFFECGECDGPDAVECDPGLGACCLVGAGTSQCIGRTTRDACESMDDFCSWNECKECDEITCDETACPNECPRNDKGSLLIFPKIEIRWDDEGNLIQDTFLMFSNDHPGDVHVQLYFVNGDLPLAADPSTGERAHPGWNWVDNAWLLTGNQPTFWSANTGRPAAGGLSPFAHGARSTTGW